MPLRKIRCVTRNRYKKGEERIAGAFENTAIVGAHGPLNRHQIVTNDLGRRAAGARAHTSREAPDYTGGCAGGIDLIDTPVVRFKIFHCARRIEYRSSLVAVEIKGST